MNHAPFATAAPGAPAAVETEAREAIALARGLCRTLADQGYGTLVEFSLNNGRRADVIGLDGAGRFVIIEIKTSEADFRADRKWPEYREHCDLFYFAVPVGFPQEILPPECGLMVADAYGAAIIREAEDVPMNGSRRRAQVLRFGLVASERLQRLADPRI